MREDFSILKGYLKSYGKFSYFRKDPLDGLATVAYDIFEQNRMRGTNPTVKQRKALENITDAFDNYTNVGKTYFQRNSKNIIEVFKELIKMCLENPEAKELKSLNIKLVEYKKCIESRGIIYPKDIGIINLAIWRLEQEEIHEEDYNKRISSINKEYWNLFKDFKKENMK